LPARARDTPRASRSATASDAEEQGRYRRKDRRRWLAPVARHDAAHRLDERRLAVQLPLLPGGERAGVLDAIDEQFPVEVVDLVLERAGGDAAHHAVDGLAVAILGRHAQ